MANTARQVKRRISTARNISKITKAMEMVAASKMKKAQEQAIAAKPFAQHLFSSLSLLTKRTDSTLHPLLSQHDEGMHIALVIATDKGLCGSLNTHLLKKLLDLRQQYGESRFGVVAVGKKAVLFCRAYGLRLVAQFTELPEKITTGDIVPVSQLLIEKFLSHDFRAVHIVYMDFVNTLKQEVRAEQLLPIVQSEVKSTLTKGWELKSSPERAAEEVLATSEYVFEPSPKAVLDELLPYYIETILFHAFLEARASEHSARMVSMKNASENASDLVDELFLIFNKSRQQGITSEILDIATASMSLT